VFKKDNISQTKYIDGSHIIIGKVTTLFYGLLDEKWREKLFHLLNVSEKQS